MPGSAFSVHEARDENRRHSGAPQRGVNRTSQVPLISFRQAEFWRIAFRYRLLPVTKSYCPARGDSMRIMPETCHAVGSSSGEVEAGKSSIPLRVTRVTRGPAIFCETTQKRSRKVPGLRAPEYARRE